MTTPLNTATTRLFTSLGFSLCMCLIVMSMTFLAREKCLNEIIIWNVYSFAPMNKATGIFVYETEYNVLRHDFHSSFHIVFLTIIL